MNREQQKNRERETTICEKCGFDVKSPGLAHYRDRKNKLFLVCGKCWDDLCKLRGRSSLYDEAWQNFDLYNGNKNRQDW